MIADAWFAFGMNPLAIALAIVAATFVLEDAATVGAALLSATGAISLPLALGALVMGIFAGDLGLYGLGRAARSQAWARARIGDARIAQGRRWLNNRLFAALLAARFIPGTRLPTYAASGFLGVPFARFAAITAGAGVLWSGAIFAIVMALGAMALEMLGPWKWAIGAVLIVALLAAPRFVRRADV